MRTVTTSFSSNIITGSPYNILFQQHHEGVTTGHNRMTEWMEAYAESHHPQESADARIVQVIIRKSKVLNRTYSL